MIEHKSKLLKVLGFTMILVLAFLVTPGLVKEAGKSNTKKKSNQTRNTEATKTTNGLAALKTGGDPDGGIRPVTPAEEKKLNAEFQKTLSHYQRHQPQIRADGSISLILAPYSLAATVAYRTADGQLKFGCTQDLESSGQQIQKVKKNSPEKLPEE